MKNESNYIQIPLQVCIILKKGYITKQTKDVDSTIEAFLEWYDTMGHKEGQELIIRTISSVDKAVKGLSDKN